MKNLKYVSSILSIVFVVACFQASTLGQSAEDKNNLAAITGSGSSVRWNVAVPYSAVTMTVSAPDGRVFRKEFKGGTSPQFTLVDDKGERLPDGQYTYELRLTPVFAPGVREELAAARGREYAKEPAQKENSADTLRDMRKRGLLPAESLVKSGGFSILNGAVVVAGAVEESGSRPVSQITEQPRLTGAPSAGLMKLRRHHLLSLAMPDQVIPDDLIVQGSICAGLDCVNNENFGFDTIRLKENNTRLQFLDTSTSAGFASNNWQIRANDSPSGGNNFLGFVDQGLNGNSETGTIVLSVRAGAPANSILVDSTGRLGLRTATPVLDIHTNTGNTPAIRLEQNSGSGFTSQTWDMAGNEANFFVRDVTSGSRLPFRIRPGAPTSSVDISATGNVGIGTASPGHHVHVQGTGIQTIAVESTQNGNNAQFSFIGRTAGGAAQSWLLGENLVTTGGAFEIFDVTAAQNRFFINTSGNVGIGTITPDQKLSVNGDASKTGGGTWAVFSDERLKNIKGNFNSGLKAVMQLQPLRYEYKRDNALDIKSEGEHIGFGAQALQKIIPEAVTKSQSGYLMVNSDPIIWSMLNAIKEQQKEIEQLKGQIRQLRATSRKRK